ncbi:type II toxin-antitoxin system PemK/MazF family toxin [Pseudonocardia bannensis]|uniref:Type II toxin-antitoxin system PemK/MazF family toxin n=1 Tax=Pseudonocardia bannensis TaxID=630973 RepID=A0A848DJE2_9PSEU|nr:type II toxin-antitoxin system PemK/MazF family toxin [Pseudonocardia bannensis]NMH92808.1 type II toxin-antitoxin system PemK/MazF family toxin [Pseudonocardia bannensis]
MANWPNLLKRAVTIGLDLLSESNKGGRRGGTAAPERPAPRRSEPDGPRPSAPARGPVRTAPAADRAMTVVYAPDLDGAADPGEIVWAWVPYEEDASQGKDRPLLVVGRRGSDLLGLMLSSQHDRAGDPNWVGIGSGAWDRQGRASFIRLDRVLEVGEHDIRREGAVLDRTRFDRVAAELRTRYGWR